MTETVLNKLRCLPDTMHGGSGGIDEPEVIFQQLDFLKG